jgi:hypothetical protein
MKRYLPVILLASCMLLVAAGVNGIFNTVTSTHGYQVAGSAGTSGQGLCSDGTYYNTPCSVFGSPFYQTVLNGGLTSGAVTQRPYLSVGHYGGIIATDQVGVGSLVSRTVLNLDVIGGTTTLGFDPYAVVTSAGGTIGQFACWDVYGGVIASTTPCGATGRTAGTNGWYKIDSDGTITNWFNYASLPNDNTYHDYTLPHAFVTSQMAIACSIDRPGGNPAEIGAKAGSSNSSIQLLSNTGGAGTYINVSCIVTGF